MIENALAAILMVVACLALVLQRLYSIIPVKELKRLASRGDNLAKELYRVAAYGAGARLLLWAGTIFSLAGAVLLVASSFAAWAVFLILVLLFVAVLVVLPSLPLTQSTVRLAAWCSPPLAWLLSHLHAPLDRAAVLLSRLRTLTNHSYLYEKEDLLVLLDNQKEQAGNRISKQDLELAMRALSFTDKKAADISQPRSAAYLVNADDGIGPLLLDQLHKQQQSSFLVYKDSQENLIGSLLMVDAIQARQGGKVLDITKNNLVFVHEDFSLTEVLEALQRTGQHLAIVINSFEEFIGVITLEGILAALLGSEGRTVERPIYENRRMIAEWTPTPALVPEVIDEVPQERPRQPEEAPEQS